MPGILKSKAADIDSLLGEFRCRHSLLDQVYMPLQVLALDIGGANLKAVHSDGSAWLQPFQLWKNPDGLAGALGQLLNSFPCHDLLAVTMTGELCDCYETKRHGVHSILDAVAVAAKSRVLVWRNDGQFVDLEVARAIPLEVAAANWLALATFVGRYVTSGPAVLIDIGSTTTDLIPLLDGVSVPLGRTDPARMKSLELVYTGVGRTPLCALLGPEYAAEFFATMLDAYMLLDKVEEDPGDTGTADGRPATKAAAHSRIARMWCSDGELASASETLNLANAVFLTQTGIIRKALRQVVRSLPRSPEYFILAGSGEFLAGDVLNCDEWRQVPRMSLSGTLGPALSHCACAHALAVLAREAYEHA